MSILEKFSGAIKRYAYPKFYECGPVELLILQSTSFCNIDCSYCYLEHRSNNNKMSGDVVRSLFDKLKNDKLLRSPYTIAWHAGEPLTAGIKYYRDIFRIVEESAPSNVVYQHSIQTNATLINSEWIDLFREFDVKIGVSVDGPKHINDAFRVKRDGSGSFDSVIRGINYLREEKYPFHTISVVSKNSLPFGGEIYRFLVDIGSTYVCFNVEEIESVNTTSSLEIVGDNAKSQFKNFIDDVLNEISLMDNAVAVREIDDALNAVRYWDGSYRGMIIGEGQQLHPFRIVSVDTAGNFSTYSPELLGEDADRYGSFNLGNVQESGFEDAYNTEKFAKIFNDLQSGVSLCRRQCEYFQFCGGGSPANKFFENGDLNSGETLFCRLHRQAIIDAFLDKAS